jgi:hypothetical protein
MIVIVARNLFKKRFQGATIWPFILIRESRLRSDPIFMNHERIHYRQQMELLVMFFYVWYVLEYLFRLIQIRNRREAYKNISFEKEAYEKENDLKYLNHRPFFRFLRYI